MRQATRRIAVRLARVKVLSSKLRLLSAYEDQASGPTVLLATVSDEQHGLGLRWSRCIWLWRARPRLLGVNMPPDQIAEAAAALSARVVGLSISEASPIPVAEAHLRRVLADCRAAPALGWRQTEAQIGLRDARLHQVVTWLELEHALRRCGVEARP